MIKYMIQIIDDKPVEAEEVSNVELLSTELDKVEVQDTTTMTPESEEIPSEAVDSELAQEVPIPETNGQTVEETNPLDADPAYDKLLLTRGQDFDLGKGVERSLESYCIGFLNDF